MQCHSNFIDCSTINSTIMHIHRTLLTTLFVLFFTVLSAQTDRVFDTTIHNDEYKIYITLNLYDKNVRVPDQDVLGEVEGYIGSSQCRSKWLIVDSRMVNDRTAELEVINDYGSEDFTAVLKMNNDGTYTFKKKNGSTLKFAVNRKWQKLPSTFQLTKK